MGGRFNVGYPIHLRHIGWASQKWRRSAMAIDTPTHRQGLDLRDPLHLVDTSMTSRAPDARGEMRAVIEVNIVGKVVHAYPLNWCVLGEGGAKLEQFEAVGANLTVALHANFGRWQRRERAALDRKVTESTIKPEISRVEFMAEFDGLNWAIANGKICVGSVVSKRYTAK